MSQKKTLLVLAAGMGSRYGGLKQLDAFGPNGETIIEYSLYDAIEAGFDRVAFIIRESFRKDFEDLYKTKIGDRVELEFISQELAHLPPGYDLPEERQKPWGTGHAVLVAKEHIDGPFAVINADDFYGRDSYFALTKFFNEGSEKEYSVIAYYLKNTLSDHGTVNRGICYQNEEGYLHKIVETLKIEKIDDAGTGAYANPESGDKSTLVPETLVSMNMFGFQANFFDKTESYFKDFLDEKIKIPKSEFLIPTVLDNMINEGYTKIKVIPSNSEWFGVTYQEDKPHVMERINTLIKKGQYPNQLWA